MRAGIFFLIIGVLLMGLPAFSSGTPLKILVFSKTAGFRHQSIPTGIEAFKKLAKEHHWEIDYSEDSLLFDHSLFKYDVLVFLNTTGDILNEAQQNVLKEYMAMGKGFVGIHAAADTEHHWPWYNKMVGGVFKSHSKIQQAVLKTSKNYNAFFGNDYRTREVKDEWYNFKDLADAEITVLTYLDEDSYTGGTHNGNIRSPGFMITEEGGLFIPD